MCVKVHVLSNEIIQDPDHTTATVIEDNQLQVNNTEVDVPSDVVQRTEDEVPNDIVLNPVIFSFVRCKTIQLIPFILPYCMSMMRLMAHGGLMKFN